MRAKIYTHLWYAKDADQAAGFYASIFPDSRVERVWTLPTESPAKSRSKRESDCVAFARIVTVPSMLCDGADVA